MELKIYRVCWENKMWFKIFFFKYYEGKFWYGIATSMKWEIELTFTNDNNDKLSICCLN